ncbi:MAG: oligosaccharide flippase family protein, partial [Candidatus Aminicenantes bacterium]|nr:oligosaccharide flippase family protein [Candidatus Aminicenantes bacterium]
GRWRPRAVFDWGALREILPFSLHLFGFNMVNYWMANLDNLLVGKVLSSHALGIYSRAYSLMLLPVTHLTRVIARVMFPVMSRLQGQESLSQRSYLKATRLIAFFSFPLMLGLLVGADLFVGVIYGPRWLPVIPILRIFCLIGMVHSVGSTTGWIYTSSGRTDIQFRWGLFVGVTRMAAIVVGLRWGLRGVAIAYAVATYAILWAPSWMIAGRIIGLRFRRMTANLAPSLGCALIMTLALQLLRRPLAALPSSPLQLLLLAASGAVLYIALNHFFRVGTWKELLSLAREVKSGRRRERERHER